MNPRRKSLTMDLDRQQAREEITVVCKQGDCNSCELAVELRENGGVRAITPEQEIRLRLLKPDHTAVYRNLPASTDGRAHILLDGVILAQSGLARAEIEIHEEDALLSTFFFYLDIRERAVPDGVLESSDEFGVLQDIIDRAGQAADQMQGAVKAAEAAAADANAAAGRVEGSIQGAENASAAAEEKAGLAAGAAQAALAQASAAQSAAARADSSAQAADQAADRANTAAEAVEEADLNGVHEELQALKERAALLEQKVPELEEAEESLEQSGTEIQAEIALLQQNDADHEKRMETLTEEYQGQQRSISELQTGKVDKVSGKGLSSNDFTASYKKALDDLTVQDLTNQFQVTGTYASKMKLKSVYQFGRLMVIDGSMNNIPDGWLSATQIAVRHRTDPDGFLPVCDTPVHIGANNTGYSSGAMTYQTNGGIYGNAFNLSGAELTIQMMFIRKGA